MCEVGGGASKGDPFEVSRGIGSFVAEDVALKSTLGTLSFERYFQTSAAGWLAQYSLGKPTEPFLPTPFGSSPGVGNSLQWWHSLYTFVVPRSGGWSVRYPTGVVANFSACDAGTAGCFAPTSSDSAENTHALYYSPAAGGSFTLYRGTEARYVYASRWSADGGTPRYFLSRIEPGAYSSAPPLAALAYATPNLSGGCPGASNGVPYIASVTTAEGQAYGFTYVKLPSPPGSRSDAGECVLSSIANGAGASLVTYTYAGNTAGLVETATFPQRPTLASPGGRVETYRYDGGNFVVLEGTTNLSVLSQLNMSGGALTSQAGAVAGGVVTQWTRGAADAGLSCLASTANPGCTGASQVGLSQESLYSGNGSTTASLAYASLLERSSSYAGARVSQETRNGLTTQWKWSKSASGRLVTSGIKDENGHYTAYGISEPDAGFPASFTRPYEVTSQRRGATDFAGTSALETTRYSYLYSDAGAYQQLLGSTTRTSTLDAGAVATTYYTYEGNRLSGVIRAGLTQRFAGGRAWAVIPRYIGTFYQAPDAFGRVTQVVGPCFVNGPSSTTCDASGSQPTPVTLFGYYGATGTSDANRLHTVTRYPNAVGGVPTGISLVTTYSGYTAFGDPTSVVGPDGVMTSYTCSESRIASRSTGGNTWRYGYDGDKLTWVQWPSGGYEVFCYRNSPVGSCQGTDAPMKQLKWRAKATTSSGGAYTEAVRYTYGADGRVATEEYLDASGNVRQTVSRAADPYGNSTYERLGTAAPAVRLFDSVGNLTGIGMPFQSAAPLCGASGPGAPPDARCAALSYDSADRLTAMEEAGATSGGSRSSRTMLTYDVQGNVSGVKMGCDAGTAWAACGVAQTTYVYDDFGNLVAAMLPDTFAVNADSTPNTAVPGRTNWEYNALGLPVRKQTPGFEAISETAKDRSLEWTYDALGRRLLFVSHFADGGTTYPDGTTSVLSSNTYDAAAVSSLPSGCSSLWGGTFTNRLTNVPGRLATSSDPLYITHYGYDQEGRVIIEFKMKRGATCSMWGKDVTSTMYDYNANGDVTKLHRGATGRSSFYNYGSGGNGRRISSVGLELFYGSSWVTSTLIKNVAWEPYGHLAKYDIVDRTNASHTATVEYRPGSASELAQTVGACDAPLPAGNDGSGRLASVSATQSTGTTLLKRFYQWQNDQVSGIFTCFSGINAVGPQAESFQYDARGQLTAAIQPKSRFVVDGAYSSRAYSYDLRGNITQVVQDGDTWNYSKPGFAGSPDMLSYMLAPVGTATATTFLDYTLDGQVGRRFTAADSSGGLEFVYQFDWGESTDKYSTLPAAFGQESVLRAVGVRTGPNATAWYNYYYNSKRERIGKDSPIGRTEFVYDLEHHLLDEWGGAPQSCSQFSGTCFPADDYVWLDGRPVIQARSMVEDFGSLLYPGVDGTGTCPREGDVAACDTYFIVTDMLGRPVLSVDHTFSVSGTGEWDPFGRMNRPQTALATPAPYPSGTNISWGGFGRPLAAGLNNTQLRVHFKMVDLDAMGDTGGDYVRLEDANGNPLNSVNPPYSAQVLSGWQIGDRWTQWVAQPGSGAAGTVKVHFDGTRAFYDPVARYSGVAVSEYEYRRFQTTYPLFTPLRGAGQYYDQETELYENWNRFYCPDCMRYLSPEPMREEPEFIVERSMDGRSLSTYAYAGNDPLRYTDSTGLYDSEHPEGANTYTECLKKWKDPARCGPSSEEPRPEPPGKPAPNPGPDPVPIPTPQPNCPKTSGDEGKDDYCALRYNKCIAAGGGRLRGNHPGESRCASCQRVCYAQGGNWPGSILGPGGRVRAGRWPCPGGDGPI